jgi:hypothetical protein
VQHGEFVVKVPAHRMRIEEPMMCCKTTSYETHSRFKQHSAQHASSQA